MRRNLVSGAIQAEANAEVVAALEVVIIERSFLCKSLRSESEDKNQGKSGVSEGGVLEIGVSEICGFRPV